MKVCYKKIKPTHIVSALVIFIFAGMTCCTGVDDTLGTGLLPGDAGMSTSSITFRGSEVGSTFVTHKDTMNTTNQAFFFLGKMTSDTFGKSKFAHMGQFMPYAKSSDEEYFGFGTNAAADSIFIHLSMTFMGGDKDKEQTFYIYELSQPIDTADGKFYTNKVAYEDYLGDKLFEFKFKGTPSFTIADSVKLDATAEGEAFMRRLIADTTLFYDFADFHKAFDGVAILPADSSPDDAAVYYTYSDNTYFKLWFHNYKPSDPATVNDVYTWGFHFSADQSFDSPNASVAIISHDYTGTPIELLLRDTTQASGLMYVQTPVGVTGKLELGDNVYDALNALVTDEYSGIYINRALLHIYMENDELDFMNAAPARLGSYTNYTDFVSIFDYDFAYEQYNQTTLPYDGYLARSLGYYNLNITMYLQQALINERYRLPITFGPDYYSSLSTLSRVSLDGMSGNNPIELSILYTLVK